MKFSTAVSVLLFTLLSLWIVPAETAPLRIFTVDEPPSNYQVELNGTPVLKGFAVDIVKAIQKQLRDYSAITLMPESRVMHLAAKLPDIAFFSISRTPEREDQFHWITQVGSKNWVFYKRADSSLQAQRLEDLAPDIRIAAVRGDIRESWLHQQGLDNLILAASPGQSLRLLHQGRADLILYEAQGIAYASRQQGFPNAAFKPMFTAHQAAIYLAMSKGTDPDTVMRWQQAARTLHDSGAILEISQRWAKIIQRKWNYECQLIYDILHC